eukprot:5580082-Alexandrium_andersonii.AAC.1
MSASLVGSEMCIRDRCGVARHAGACAGVAWRGPAMHRSALCGVAWRSMAWSGVARCGLAWRG